MGSSANNRGGRCAPAASEEDSMTQDVGAAVDETVGEKMGKTIGKTGSSASAPLRGNIRSRRLLLRGRTMYRGGRTPVASGVSIQLLGRLEEGRLRDAVS